MTACAGRFHASKSEPEDGCSTNENDRRALAVGMHTKRSYFNGRDSPKTSPADPRSGNIERQERKTKICPAGPPSRSAGMHTKSAAAESRETPAPLSLLHTQPARIERRKCKRETCPVRSPSRPAGVHTKHADEGVEAACTHFSPCTPSGKTKRRERKRKKNPPTRTPNPLAYILSTPPLAVERRRHPFWPTHPVRENETVEA